MAPQLTMKHGLCSGAGGQVRKKRARLNYKGAQNVVGTHGSIFLPLLYFFKVFYILVVLVATEHRILSKSNTTIQSGIIYCR